MIDSGSTPRPLPQNFLKFVKSCILSSSLQFDNKENGVIELVFELKELKAKDKGVLTGCVVAMMTCYVERMIATSLPMTWHLCETVIVASLAIV